MKNCKKHFLMLLTILSILILSTSYAMAAGGARPKKIQKITGPSTVMAGQIFRLRAKTTPARINDNYLRWSILSGKNVIRFHDKDRYDDDIELEALKAGKAKVRCSIKGKSKRYAKTITIRVKKPAYTMTPISSKQLTVEQGEDCELRVRLNRPIYHRHLKWTIKDPSLLKFIENKRYGTYTELLARKPGSTAVTCKNLLTKKSVTFLVKVIPSL